MIIDLITQADITERPLFYSRWHSCSTSEQGPHIDINIAGLVGPILSIGNDMFIVCVYLTQLINLDDNYTVNPSGYKVWDISAGTMILEDTEGIRLFGTIESLIDLGELGLKVTGTSCLFTDNSDEAYVESFFSIRDLIPKDGDTVGAYKDYSNAINHVNQFEMAIKDFVPERFI